MFIIIIIFDDFIWKKKKLKIKIWSLKKFNFFFFFDLKNQNQFLVTCLSYLSTKKFLILSATISGVVSLLFNFACIPSSATDFATAIGTFNELWISINNSQLLGPKRWE